MTAPTRSEAIEILLEGRTQIASLISRLSDRQLEAPATIGGGDWSAKDLIGHLAFWEELALDALSSWRRGEKPRVEDIFGEGVDAVNAEEQARIRVSPLTDVVKRSEETSERIVSEIERIPDDEWLGEAPYPSERRRNLAQLLSSVLGSPEGPFRHASAHLEDLRRYVEEVSS